MKLLLWYCDSFEFKTSINTLDEYKIEAENKIYKDLIVAFIQVEESDETDINNIEKKAVKQIKWAAGKNKTKRVLLHSFAHLSESKAEPNITKQLLNQAQTRLENTDYETHQTPFGYFLDLKMDAPGKSLARIFKSF